MAEKKKGKFNWEGIQNATAASVATGLTTPFILAPFDIAEVTQNTKPLAHMPKNAPLSAIYKELFTNPQVVKQIYTKSVPARLIKNIPAQAATLGSFSLYKELFDYYNPPLTKQAGLLSLGKTVVTGLGRLGRNMLDVGWEGSKMLGRGIKATATNKDFMNTFINLPSKNAKFLSVGGVAGIGTNLALRGGLNSVSQSDKVLENMFKNTPKPPSMKITGLSSSGKLTKESI